METKNAQPAAEMKPTELFKLALDELTCRVRRGESQVSEHVLAAYPPVAGDKESCLELLYTEFVLRQEQGEQPAIAEWTTRFPAWEADIRELFEVHNYVSRGEAAEGSVATTTVFDSWWFEGRDKSSPGHRQLGNYQLLEEIGRGGMGTVYRARHVALDRQVALKTLHGHDGFQPESLGRFRAEAEAAARLQHPNIVQIYEVGLCDGQPYFTMEHVAGGNLAAAIRQRPLPPRTAARLLAPVARAIHFAHERGVVHRDLKPANLLLAASERTEAAEVDHSAVGGNSSGIASRYELKITDFGLAKRLDSDQGRTITGATLGTPSYMSPEQAGLNSHSVGPACDIYSLGAVLYDMLAGRPPFHSATVSETLERVRHDDPISIRSIQPTVPRDLETICLKCLQKDPRRRYSSAAALADDLDRFLKGRPILARPVGPAERAFKWMKRYPAIAAFLVAILLGALGIGWQWYRAETNRATAEHQAQLATDAQAKEHAERQRVERTLYAHDVSLANFEFLSNNTIRARQLLASCQPELRGWEWNYLHQTIEDQQWESEKFAMPVRCVAISPDGSLVAAASAIWGTDQRGEVRVWNVRTNKLVQRLTEHPNSIMDVCFSPDGERLISTGTVWQQAKPAGGLHVWDLMTGHAIWSLENVNSHAAAYSPDGQAVVIGHTDGKITLHDAETGKLRRNYTGHKGVVFDISFRPDGKSFVSANRDGSFRVWDFETGNQIAAVTNLIDVRAVTCSPNGTDIAICTFGGDINIYAQRGVELHSIFTYHHGEQVTSVRFSPDGQYLAVTAVNDAIKLIDPKTAQTVREFHGHNGVAVDAGFSGDGRALVTCGLDGMINLWDLTQPSRQRKQNIQGPFHEEMAFLPHGDLVAIAMGFNSTGAGVFNDRTIKLWNIATGRIERNLAGHTDWLTSVAADPQARWLLSGSRDKTAILWDLPSGKARFTLRGHSAPVMDVDFLAQGSVAVTADQQGDIRSWNTEDGQQIGQWKTNGGGLHSLACHPREPWIAHSDEAGEIWFWNIAEKAPSRRLNSLAGPICDLCYSPDGKSLAAAHQDGTISLWKDDELFKNGEGLQPAILHGHTSSVSGIGFSPDGHRLISASTDRTVKLWDVASALEVMSFPAAGKSGSNSRVAFSPAADRIVHLDATVAEIWEIRDPAELPATSNSQMQRIVRWHQAELQRATAGEYWSAVAFHCRALVPSELPNKARYHVQCGDALAHLERWSDAIDELESALVLEPSSRNFALLAHYYLYGGDYAGHQKTCRRHWAQFENTTNLTVLNNVAWAAALAPGVLPELRGLAEKLETAAANSKSSAILNTLGAVYLRSNQYDRAISTLEASIRVQPTGGVPQDWLLLALAQAATGDRDAAIKRLEQARTWVSEQNHKRDTRQQLDPFDTWSNRQEIELLLREVETVLSKFITATT